jgi:tol-pal system protein YbgF
LTAACAPQAELVKTRNDMNDLRAEIREMRTRVPDLSGFQKRLDAMERNVKGTTDLQKTVADHGARFDQFTTDLQILQGKLEENNFRIKELAHKLDDKAYQVAELASRLEQMEDKLKSLPSGTPAAPGAEEKKPEAKAPSPTEAYLQAKIDYDKGNFDLAIAGFQNYLRQFPDASQADSAQYWIGESYYGKKDYSRAIEEFTRVLKNHPRSDKAPGARLKIGYAYLSEKNTVRAREHLNRVVKDYPNSREAELARERLRKIGK